MRVLRRKCERKCERKVKKIMLFLTCQQLIQNLEITLHAINRSHNPRTMRVKGRFGNQWVTILIDTESTHNFLDLAILKKSNFLVDDIDKVKVRVANGDYIPSEGKCSD